MSYFAPFTRDGRSMPGLEKANEGEYLADRLTDEAVAFIRSKATQPFFLYLPHFSVNTPMAAKPDLVAKYPPVQPFAGRQNNPVYAAMLESLDASVGRIVETLRELKLLDNTLVIFTSDNGGLATREGPNTPATSNAPLREGKPVITHLSSATEPIRELMEAAKDYGERTGRRVTLEYTLIAGVNDG